MLTLEAALITGIVGVSSALALLWRNTEASTQRLVKKVDECEGKHDAQNAELKQVYREIGELRGRQEGVSQLAEQVLAAVVNARGKHGNASDTH